MIPKDTFDRLVGRLYVLSTPYARPATIAEITQILITLQTAPGTECFTYPLVKPNLFSRWEYKRHVRTVIIYDIDYVLRKALFGYKLKVRAHYQKKGRTLRLPCKTGKQLWQLATTAAEANAQKVDLNDPHIQRALDQVHLPNLDVLYLKATARIIEAAIDTLNDMLYPPRRLRPD